MHELSVVQGMLDIVSQKAEEISAPRVVRINLVVGEISSIVDDCVQFYFDFLAKDTIAEEAELHFERIPLKFRCRKCDTTFFPQKSSWSCPNCGSERIEIVGGSEFYIDSIEVE